MKKGTAMTARPGGDRTFTVGHEELMEVYRRKYAELAESAAYETTVLSIGLQQARAEVDGLRRDLDQARDQIRLKDQEIERLSRLLPATAGVEDGQNVKR